MGKFKLFIFTLIFVGASFGILFIQKSKVQTKIPLTSLPVVPPVSAISTTSVTSADGSETLILEKKSGNQNLTWSFFANNSLIFTKTSDNNSSFVMPFNSFSPDNKYVFIKETTGNTNNFYVLNIKNPDNPVNVTDEFNQKLPNYKLDDMTGWASPTLLIVNTKDNSNNLVSFWFDIIGRSFIQLSTKFN